MIDFEKFFLGEVGLIVKRIEEASEILEACDDGCIAIDSNPEDYELFPYWYVAYGTLNLTRDYSDAMEHVEHVYTYQTYAFDNQI